MQPRREKQAKPKVSELEQRFLLTSQFVNGAIVGDIAASTSVNTDPYPFLLSPPT